jgi:putative ABC transport system substrate-binding protein
MRRREFIAAVGAVVAWPVAARAQERERLRKIGVIMNYAENDSEGQARFSALREQLLKLGLTDQNSIIEVRWAAGKSEPMLTFATQFVSQPVDVIVANSTPLLRVLKQLTSSIPIVFVQVADPVASGFVTSYARPGGNITGFTDFDTSIAGKWVELLKKIVPLLNRVTVLLDPDQTNHQSFLHAIESAAPTFKVQVFTAEVRDRPDVERAIGALIDQVDHGLVVLPGPINNTQRDLIIQSAARFRLPAIYPFKYYANEGGLLYY